MKTALPLLLLALACHVQGQQNEFVSTFLSEFHQWKLESDPMGASFEGRHEFDSALGDSSPEGAKKAKDKCVEFKGKADAILKVINGYANADLLCVLCTTLDPSVELVARC